MRPPRGVVPISAASDVQPWDRALQERPSGPLGCAQGHGYVDTHEGRPYIHVYIYKCIDIYVHIYTRIKRAFDAGDGLQNYITG